MVREKNCGFQRDPGVLASQKGRGVSKKVGKKIRERRFPKNPRVKRKRTPN